MNSYEEHRLVVAFDSRPITLAVMRKLVERDGTVVFLAAGGSRADQKRVQEAFRLGSKRTQALALCSNAMAEGINLQQASAVVHLDMPSVVRIAEQRVGRIDRMDSPHDKIESWWPKDAREFALSTDEKLDERLLLVENILGSNVSLPSDGKPRAVRPQDFVREVEEDERRQLELLDDAFAPVRALVEGPTALVEPDIYTSMRKSKAKVLSAVAVIRADSPWGFFAFPGTKRTAPRWVLVDTKQPVMTALDDVAERLREHLKSPEDVELNRHAIEVMHGLLAHLQSEATSLLPRRKRRALEQMRVVLAFYRRRALESGDVVRAQTVDQLLDLAGGEQRADLDELMEAWIAAIRPIWREALRNAGSGRRRGKLRRLDGLTPKLKKHELSTVALRGVVERAHAAVPLADRMIAAIVGVPDAKADNPRRPSRARAESASTTTRRGRPPRRGSDRE